MQKKRQVEVYGDSILRGVQLDNESSRYRVLNNIDIDMLEKKFRLCISNFSKFGCTITKACSVIQKRFEGDKSSAVSTPRPDAVIMNLGGNDCDFDWKAIAEHPEGEHKPNTPIEVFAEKYKKIIEFLKDKDIRPVITTLPPLSAQKFFNWFCGGLEKKANVLKWLGGVEAIYRWQENYSRTIERLAGETEALLVDLRGAFLKHRKIEQLLCADGAHPNTEGQKVITQSFMEFIINAKAKGKIQLYA
ncbi:MAG: SGNH/GDSL hydrolase family protein [Oscillospiraceae bacterium]|nr:SGNH/GDSL hydrolase family protein [Oscillospiraceae bacterium]